MKFPAKKERENLTTFLGFKFQSDVQQTKWKMKNKLLLFSQMQNCLVVGEEQQQLFYFVFTLSFFCKKLCSVKEESIIYHEPGLFVIVMH